MQGPRVTAQEAQHPPLPTPEASSFPSPARGLARGSSPEGRLFRVHSPLCPICDDASSIRMTSQPWVDAVRAVFRATALGKGLQPAKSPRRSCWMVCFSMFTDTRGLPRKALSPAAFTAPKSGLWPKGSCAESKVQLQVVSRSKNRHRMFESRFPR